MLVCVCTHSPKCGQALRRVWQGRMIGGRNPAACWHPPLSSGPPVGRTSDLNSSHDRHDTQVRPLPPSYCQEWNVDDMALSLNIIMSFIPSVSSPEIMPNKQQTKRNTKKAHLLMYMLCVCMCDPDPTSLPRHDTPADLIPPELPPKGIRRRQPPSKVEQRKRKLLLPAHHWKSQKYICIYCIYI